MREPRNTNDWKRLSPVVWGRLEFCVICCLAALLECESGTAKR